MNIQEPRILLVDDEKDIIEFLTYNLKKEGFLVQSAVNGKEAISKAVAFKPHLILLDVMMPGMDGIEACDELRKIPELEKTLIAFLTARGEDYSQIAGFEAGADDYITKPVKPKVLLSRIKALLKRYGQSSGEDFQTSDEQIITHNDITIDKNKYVVIQNGRQMELPRKEFELLSLLVSKPDRVFTRDEIFHQIWGDDVIVGDRTIDVHIRKLREKIGEDRIKTIKGVGYKFEG
ncbi:MAG: response regulator transcription factor [Bacteroidales bacterium]|jgi:two-component system alkaline phosphatase synthesis response regulator PhoP|nr:response regulator transcription factor [Bacteroidales bacterium]